MRRLALHGSGEEQEPQDEVAVLGVTRVEVEIMVGKVNHAMMDIWIETGLQQRILGTLHVENANVNGDHLVVEGRARGHRQEEGRGRGHHRKENHQKETETDGGVTTIWTTGKNGGAGCILLTNGIEIGIMESGDVLIDASYTCRACSIIIQIKLDMQEVLKNFLELCVNERVEPRQVR